MKEINLQQTGQRNPVRFRSKLQVQMTITYVWVTVIIVLLLEILVSTLFYLLLTRSPLLGAIALYRAQQAAQTYAFEAAAIRRGNALNPLTTFTPGQSFSLTAQLNGDSAAHIPSLTIGASNQPAGAPNSHIDLFALLIAPDGSVLASSSPSRIPVSTPVTKALPDQTAMIQDALAGRQESKVEGTSQERLAYVARPVLGEGNRPIGAIFIQSMAGTNNNATFSNIALGWVRSALGWMILMLPFGALFGFVTTRSMVKRVKRLADATADFAGGDYSRRVTPGRLDEIGQLEQQFNWMAAQLVESIAREKAITEQSARQEERARIEQELQTAQYIQHSLLPKEVPSIPGWQFEPFYQPAREVGGDLYDFLPLPDGKIGIAIGDATGKGIGAALVMATTCTVLRSTVPGIGSPGEALARINELLHSHVPGGVFVTCFYAVLDPTSGRLRYANAGHDLPYWLDGDQAQELRAVGMPLGLMPGERYEECEVTLDPGESILFYTDGLVEAHNPVREMFGFPRLIESIQSQRNPDHLIQFLLEELGKFTGPDWEQEDDVTLLTLRRGE